MNRPLIKGTPLHKTSIVAQTQTQADGKLVASGDALGKSYIPAAIDYSGRVKNIEIPEMGEDKDKDKDKDKDEKAAAAEKKPGQYITQEDLDKANAEARAQYDERRKAGDVSKSGKIWDGKQWVEKEIWKDILEKSKSPLETRDDRVYRKALENGPVRRNMIKSGYKPQ